MVLISVIIPTYNSAHTVADAVRSVLSQEYANTEVIIVDGLSTDSTLQVIENTLTSYKGEKPVRIVSEPDKGIYDAMNKGLKMARGEFVYFLGSDDALLDTKLLSTVFSGGNEAYDVIYGNVFNEDLNRLYDGEFNLDKIMNDGICHQSIFYRRSLFDTYGMYNIEMKVYAHIFLDKILFTDERVKWIYVDIPIARYSGSGMSSSTYDYTYWREAEGLYLRCFRNKRPLKQIYSSLMPIPRYDFSFFSLQMAFKIAFHTRSFLPVKYWMSHIKGYLPK